MTITEKLKGKINSFEISAKITSVYAACFILLLALINAAMYFGVNYAIYNPAEKTILYSMEQVEKLLGRLEENYDDFNSGSFQGVLVAGVVLRVADANGEVFIDTDSSYPSIDFFNRGILLDPPFFSNRDFEISKVGSALIYCKKMDYSHDGAAVTLYFFRTITSELTTIDDMVTVLIALDVFGFFLALGVGYKISRRILTPIKTMSDLAREIAFEKMDERIPIGTANDELNQLAKTFNDMLDRLKREIDRQKEFVAYTSHELGQPATIFSGYASLLKNGGKDDPELLDEAIEAFDKGSTNLEKLLRNISLLSRSDRKVLAFNKKVLDIDDIISEIMRSTKVYVRTHKVELASNEPAKVLGEEAAITQLIRIFLENAIKYTPEGGNVKITSVVEGDKVLVSISDTGIGISPENQEKIFDRGFRVNNNSEIKGSGLGLAMAKIIADNHDIKISVDSELGKGTTFTLIIPKEN